MAGIVFEGVGKVFPDGTSAVCDLDLAVPDGEFCVLVGPSGSGKSTALRMVAGLEEVTTGTIRIGDRDVTDVAPRDRDIAMVFQSYALYPHMSVESNLGFALKMAGEAKPSIRDRVAAAGDRLGIGELLHRRPRALSGGQRQRVALGRAIVRAPQAFLMDEPLSNLDAKLRVEMRAYIARLHQELGTTVLYVTHDQVEAMTMGDRVAVMRDGRLEQVDTPQALYDRPANLFVAAFIGSPAMNLVRGRLEEDGGRLAVWLGAHRIALPGARPELYARASEDVIVGHPPRGARPDAPGRRRAARAARRPDRVAGLRHARRTRGGGCRRGRAGRRAGARGPGDRDRPGHRAGRAGDHADHRAAAAAHARRPRPRARRPGGPAQPALLRSGDRARDLVGVSSQARVVESPI